MLFVCSHTLSEALYNWELDVVFLRFICGFKEEKITCTDAGRVGDYTRGYASFVDDMFLCNVILTQR